MKDILDKKFPSHIFFTNGISQKKVWKDKASNTPRAVVLVSPKQLYLKSPFAFFRHKWYSFLWTSTVLCGYFLISIGHGSIKENKENESLEYKPVQINFKNQVE